MYVRTYGADDGVSEIKAVIKIPLNWIGLVFGVIINRFSTVS